MLCSPRGQGLIKKYQGRYKMIDLNSSMSTSRNSGSSKREGYFSRYSSPSYVHNISTTNAKEFRNILKHSVRRNEAKPAEYFLNSEKEVKMNEIEDDTSSKRVSDLSKQDCQTDLNFDKENSSKQLTINSGIPSY